MARPTAFLVLLILAGCAHTESTTTAPSAFEQPFAGGEPLRLTWSPGNDRTPQWSSDAGHIMYAFDDEGGSFPLQEIGVTTSGHLPSERLGLQYVAEIGNGRNHLLGSDPAQNHHDSNNGKSVNFALSSRPSAIPGLDVGFSIYHDYVTFEDNINHGEVISTVHVVYMNSTYEFLNEAALIRHSGASDGSPGTFHTPAFYTQISRKFGKYRPYFRYQYMNAGVTEPIFGDPEDGTVVGRRNSASLGVRWDFNDHAAWKLQYDYLTRRGSDLVSDRTVRSGSGIATEFSFAF